MKDKQINYLEIGHKKENIDYHEKGITSNSFKEDKRDKQTTQDEYEPQIFSNSGIFEEDKQIAQMINPKDTKEWEKILDDMPLCCQVTMRATKKLMKEQHEVKLKEIREMIEIKLKCARDGAVVGCNKGFYCWTCSSRIKILKEFDKLVRK